MNRQEGDYADFMYFDLETVTELYPTALEFIKAVDDLIDID